MLTTSPSADIVVFGLGLRKPDVEYTDFGRESIRGVSRLNQGDSFPNETGFTNSW